MSSLTQAMIINAVVLFAVLEADVGPHRKIGPFRFVRPLLMTVAIVPLYLTALTTHGTGLTLEIAGAVAGALLGLLATSLMAVYRSPKTGKAVSRAGLGYAAVWTVAIGVLLRFRPLVRRPTGRLDEQPRRQRERHHRHPDPHGRRHGPDPHHRHDSPGPGTPSARRLSRQGPTRPVHRSRGRNCDPTAQAHDGWRVLRPRRNAQPPQHLCRAGEVRRRRSPTSIANARHLSRRNSPCSTAL
jgi:hypothetical protein